MALAKRPSAGSRQNESLFATAIAVDGVDGVFIGPGDLSAHMGHLANSGHLEIKAAIDDAVKRIGKTGRAAGILTPGEADARHWLELGCLFAAVGSDVRAKRSQQGSSKVTRRLEKLKR